MLTFRNAVERSNADGRINSGNDQATPGINLVVFDQYIQSSRESTVYNRRQSALGLVYLHLLGGNTAMFCYYLLGGETVVPSGLYTRFCHAFLVCLHIHATPPLSLHRIIHVTSYTSQTY